MAIKPGKRELIDTGKTKRFTKRNQDGTFKEYFSGIITPEEDNTLVAVLSSAGWIIYSSAASLND